MADPTNVERAVVAQWQAAGPALEEVRIAELRALSDAEALAVADVLLALVTQLPRRDGGSGLVEQQRLFSLLLA